MATSKGLNFTKEELQELYDLGLSNTKIAEIYGVTNRTIINWAKKLNCTTDYSIPKLQLDFFHKIDSKEKAYMLGFLLGDGSIDKQNHMNCSISLKDKEVLYCFSEWVGCKVTEKDVLDVKRRIYPYTSIHFGQKQIMKDVLMLFGGRLKEERHIPIISKKYESYLVQGFFDAEGCITFGYRKDRNRFWKAINFTSQYKMLYGIQKRLENNDIISSIHPKSNNKCYILDISSKDINIISFLNYIYQDENFVILKRKYEKAQALRQIIG